MRNYLKSDWSLDKNEEFLWSRCTLVSYSPKLSTAELTFFIDESGLTQIPNRVSHMGAAGQTPVLTHVGSWKKVNTIKSIDMNI
ncbi:hypothetical protein [Leptospira alexanderi]|uniref:hypothetical protein n=1 Tax=Leptospira alexanderi TaxID=100053 RepID=UPI001591DC1A|nr:hypothetical protein [Leptospira alexanderi]